MENDMVTEDYVSFETAKLMHDKGFNLAEFHGRWAIDFDNVPNTEEEDPEGKIIVAEWQYPLITIQMTMKWLRKEHNLAITTFATKDGWCSYVSQIKLGVDGFIVDVIDDIDEGNIPDCDTYEEACEAAIKYCLEHLI